MIKKLANFFKTVLDRPIHNFVFTCRGRGSFDSQRGDQDNQTDMIILEEPYVEALRKRTSAKNILQWNSVYVSYFRFSACGCDLFNDLVIK